jgi:hypothetical protein
MPLRTAQIGDTVSLRTTRGRTFNATVLGTQATAPTLNVPTSQTTGGTIATGVTCSYRLTTVKNGAESLASTAQSVVTGAGSTNQCTITWPAVTGASSYRVYGRTAGTQLFMQELPAGTLTWIDTGAVTPTGALPTTGEVGVHLPFMKGAAKLQSVAKATGNKQTDVYYLR